MKAIVPTGERGVRMQPLTFSTNKHFIPVANKPLIFYPIESVAEAGIKDVAITYNPGWLDLVKGFLGDGSKWGLKFTYVLQPEPLGLANIVEVCEDFVDGDRFFLHLGDNIFTEGIKELVDYFERRKPYGLITKIRHPENWRMGVPVFDKQGRLKDYLEKPKNPPNEFAVPGIYFFDSVVFGCFRGRGKILPSERGEYEIVGPFKWLIKRGFRVEVIEYKGRWLDPGKFDDWILANQYILDISNSGQIKSKIGPKNVIQGRVGIGKNCKIQNSTIRGPVLIGENVTIRDSFIGPYTSISNNSLIEKSRVENSVIMEGVKIVNVERPIDSSLVGSQTEIIGADGHSDWVEFFVGEKSRLKI